MSLTTLLRDFGTRTAVSGWGTPLVGPAYTTLGGVAGDYAVSAGAGTMSVTAVNTSRATIAAVNTLDVDIRADLTVGGPVPTGANVECGIRARYVDASNFVDIRLFAGTNNAVTMAIRQLVAGVETFVGFPVVAGANANTTVSVRLAANGNRLMAKAWPAGAPEPALWLASMTTTMLTAGSVYTYISVPTGYTAGTPVPFSVANLTAVTGVTPLGFVVPLDTDVLCGTGTPTVTAIEQLAESVQAWLTASELDSLVDAAAPGVPRAQVVKTNYSVTSTSSTTPSMDSVAFNSNTPTDLAVYPQGAIENQGIWWVLTEAIMFESGTATGGSVGNGVFATFPIGSDANPANFELFGGGNQALRLRRTVPNNSETTFAGWVGGGNPVWAVIAMTIIQVSENVT